MIEPERGEGLPVEVSGCGRSAIFPASAPGEVGGVAVERRAGQVQKGGLGSAFTRIDLVPCRVFSTWVLHTLKRSNIQEFL